MDHLIDDIDILKCNTNVYEISLDTDTPLTDAQREQVKRLEFSVKTKRVLAQRVGYRCSCPNCTNITIGPGDTQTSVVLLGEAAHIVGAIRKDDGLSPRADSSKTEEEITALDNGIWLCRHHHKLVDAKSSKYTVNQLKSWKKQAEEKRAELMEVKEPDFVDKYIFPNISTNKGISTKKFRNCEWCLLAYLIEYYDDRICYRDFETDDDGRNFFSEYQNWMSKNAIDSELSCIRFNSFFHELISDIRDVVNNLTGLVIMDNNCLKYGKLFDDFVYKIFEDEQALEKIKLKLSKV